MQTTPLYISQWDLIPTAVLSINQELIDRYGNTLQTDTHYMKPNKLQCTAHIHRGPDVEYENKLFKASDVNEKCTLKGLFWDVHRCAASVYLKPRTNTETPFNRNPWHPKPDFPFDVNNSAPHVSLAKGIRDQKESPRRPLG